MREQAQHTDEKARRTCDAMTLNGEPCAYRAHFDHAVFVGVRVCGHHEGAPFIKPEVRNWL